MVSTIIDFRPLTKPKEKIDFRPLAPERKEPATLEEAFDLSKYKPPIDEPMGFDVPGPAEPGAIGPTAKLEEPPPQVAEVPRPQPITTPRDIRGPGTEPPIIGYTPPDIWEKMSPVERHAGEALSGPMQGIIEATQIPKLMGIPVEQPKTISGKIGRVTGQIIEGIGELLLLSGGLKALGVLSKAPRGGTFVRKAFDLGTLFATRQATEEARKGVAQQLHPEIDAGYEGAPAVAIAFVEGAIISMAFSGVSGIWGKLRPTEQSRALKVLGLKKGATSEQIKAASRRLLFKYHPDKAKGMRAAFDKVIKARETLWETREDIIKRGVKPVKRGLALPPGEAAVAPIAEKPPTEAIVPKKPIVTPPPTKPIVKPPAKPVAKQPWEMSFADYRNTVLDKMTELEPDIRATIADKERPIHKAAVAIAIQQGKPVPAEVLAEYPDLAKPEGKALGPQEGTPERDAIIRSNLVQTLRQSNMHADLMTAADASGTTQKYVKPVIEQMIKDGEIVIDNAQYKLAKPEGKVEKVTLPYAYRKNFEQLFRFMSAEEVKTLPPLVRQWKERLVGVAGREPIRSTGQAYRTTMKPDMHKALMKWAQEQLKIHDTGKENSTTRAAKGMLRWLEAIKAPRAKEVVTKKFYTSVPEEWRKVQILYDWGQKGLRAQYEQPGRGKGIKVDGRRRKTFIWQNEFEELSVGNQKVLREARKLTDEIWPVKERRGKFWTTKHYLIPKQVMAKIRTAIIPKAKAKDLIGRPVLEGGAAGKQQELLEKEEYRLPKADIEGQAKMAFKPGFADLGPIVDTAHKVHDKIFTFGEVARENPKLYDQLMKSYGQRNAAVEKAVSEIEKQTTWRLSQKEAMDLAIAYEDKRLSAPKGLTGPFKEYSKILKQLEQQELAEGIFQRPFQERMTEEIGAQIETELFKLRSKGKADSKKLKALATEEEMIKNMRYLPHNVVVQRMIGNKLRTLQGKERQTFLNSLSRISAQFKKRKGRLRLEDYLKAGVIKPTDIDIRKFTADALTDYYWRSAMKSLFDYGKDQDLIKPTSKKLREQGWLNQREIGITSPELKNKLMHPLYASGLAEMKDMRRQVGGFLRRPLAMVKIGQFIKPTIIWTYNAVQKYMRGMYSLNPVKEARYLAQAFMSVVRKDELYHKLNESNLYQFPYEVSKASRDQQISHFVRKNSTDISRLIPHLEKVTGVSLSKDELLQLKKSIPNALMAGTHAIAQSTWFGDKVQRTQSYMILRDMGYSHDEAVKVASKSHGAYSALSTRYKKVFSPLLFVYSFRILMPIEMGKIALEPVLGIIRAVAKKEKIPAYKVKQWGKALVATVLIPLLIDEYMKLRGFKKEGVHLGPLAWKWKKQVTVDGKKSEIVVGMNYILNIWVKYGQRLTYYNPIRPQARWQQSLENIVKWEIHPLWRIFFWDIYKNRRSFGSGVEVYDRTASPLSQLGQVAGYVFGQSLRFWGGMMDAMGEGKMTEKERKGQEKIFDVGLTKLDRILFSVFGYKYTRRNKPERQKVMKAYLLKEYKRHGFGIMRKYDGEERRKRMKDLNKWRDRCLKWIEQDMK